MRAYPIVHIVDPRDRRDVLLSVSMIDPAHVEAFVRRGVALERIASDLICAAWPADLLAKAQALGGACDRARRGELPLAQLADLARAVEAS